MERAARTSGSGALRGGPVAATVAATLGALVVLAGCGGSDGRSDAAAGSPASVPAEREVAVTGDLALDRPPAGSPDGGQPAGHRGGAAEAAVRGASFAFRGRVRPAAASVSVASPGPATARVDRDSGGRFVVRVARLRRGPNRFAVTGAMPGRPAWLQDVVVRRIGRADPPTEPQAAEPDRGSPGAAEPSGGKVDIDLTADGARPDEVRVRVGQIVVWRNEDTGRHTVTSRDPGGPRSAQLNPGDRFEWTPRAPGTVRYASTLRGGMRGVVRVAP
jgi:plastocyanin